MRRGLRGSLAHRVFASTGETSNQHAVGTIRIADVRHKPIRCAQRYPEELRRRVRPGLGGETARGPAPADDIGVERKFWG